MARNVPSGTTAATAEKATAPAPASKPATATLPKPTTAAPARSAATAAPKPATPPKTAPSKPPPARPEEPKSTLPAEYQTVVSRNIFDSSASVQPSRPMTATWPAPTPTPEAAPAGPVYGPEAPDLYAPYLEAVRGISALRTTGEIGTSIGARRSDVGLPSTFTTYPSMTQTPSSERYDPGMSLEEMTARRRGTLAPPVMPPQDISGVKFGQLASTARSVDLAYQAAWDEAGNVDRALRTAALDPSKTPNDLKALEDEKTRALRRVADLAAARREFGMATPSVPEGQTSALAPAPVVGPRTGGGKEYY